MRWSIVIVSLLAACGPVVGIDGDSSTGDLPMADASTVSDDDDDDSVADDDSVGEEEDDGDETPEYESSGVAESTAPGEGSSGVEATQGCLFICEPDGGGVAIECDIWQQDCPDGEKCAPWANDGGNSWNATKCVPVDPMPGDLEDPCTVEDSAVSGIDSCKVGAICWDVDPETNMGECIGLCQGPEANPTCEDPNANCSISGDGVLALCITTCDPLVQNCNKGDACYPIVDTFNCVPDNSGDAGAYGDECDFLDVCDPGSFCASPENVPGCAGNGCCTPFCDFSDVNASAGCPGVAGGQECVAWYEEGQAPPGYEYTGACLIPD